MISIQIVFVFLLLHLSKCEVHNKGSSTHNYTSYINGDKIHNITEYCKLRRCISKCCHGDTVFFSYDKVTSTFPCMDRKATAAGIRIETFSDTKIYKSDIEQKIAQTTLGLKDFEFVYNDKFFVSNLETQKPVEPNKNMYLLEDASLMIEAPNYYPRWLKRLDGPADYCMDLVVVPRRNKPTLVRIRIGRVPEPQIDIKKSDGSDFKDYYIAVAMLISSFFLLLVLIVYGLLPKLRNIVGMVLMAYVVNLLVLFVLRALYTLLSFRSKACSILSPIMYFSTIASFFWLNIMSFDIWWTFRGTRKCRDIHRRGELVKFLWYCLYAWGIPLAVTISVVVLDNSDVPAYIVKPHFHSCLYGVYENIFYQYVPILILTVVNCVLFVLTVYNIWLIHRGMRMFNAKDSQKNKNNENRFGIFIKMSVLMGISWILEVVQSFVGIDAQWLYVLVNLYNASLGVPIFFFFVFKKSIFVLLCKRLNIINKFTTRMESSSRNTGMSDSARKYGERAETEVSEVAIDLKDMKNMSEVSFNPQ